MRLEYVLMQMEQQPNVFPMCILLLSKVIKFFSGVIDVERCNGIKKWLINSRREAMRTEKLDMLLRIFYNSPGINNKDRLNEFIIESMKTWNNAAIRKHSCKKLNVLSGKIIDIDCEDND